MATGRAQEDCDLVPTRTVVKVLTGGIRIPKLALLYPLPDREIKKRFRFFVALKRFDGTHAAESSLSREWGP